MQYILGSLLILSSLHLGNDYIHFQWFMAIPTLGLGFLYYAYCSLWEHKKIRAVCSTGLYYLLCNAAYVGVLRSNRFSNNPGAIKALMAYAALDQVFLVTFITLALILLKHHKPLLSALGIWGLANSIYTIHGFIVGDGILSMGIGYSGFLNYASVNACVIACTIPFLPKISADWWPVPHIAVILACLLSKSSIPIGTLLIVYGTMALMHFATKQNYLKIISVVSTIFISSLAIASYFDRSLFDSGYRFTAYRVFMQYWWNNANMFFGFGPGTFQMLAPTIQNEVNFMVSHDPDGHSFFWIHLHSEWLQVLWEHGAAGLFFTSTLFILMTWVFIKKHQVKELASLMGIAACSLFNFPVRYFIGSMLVGALLLAAINLEEEVNSGILDSR